eukprot:404875-Karenia_brevis.AAC.1
MQLTWIIELRFLGWTSWMCPAAHSALSRNPWCPGGSWPRLREVVRVGDTAPWYDHHLVQASSSGEGRVAGDRKQTG